jgi:hypothetical protein
MFHASMYNMWWMIIQKEIKGDVEEIKGRRSKGT